MLNRTFLPLLLVSLSVQAQAATTYYVNDTSNKMTNATNKALLPPSAQVFATLQAAENNSALVPGDTILVMNGTYTGGLYWSNGVLVISKSGMPGKPITIAAYPGHHPIISTAGNLKTLHGIDIQASWISILGFEIIGKARDLTLTQANASSAKQLAAYKATKVVPFDVQTDGNCISIDRQTHITITNNVVHDCSASGISAEASDYITISSNIVYNNSWWTDFDTSGINIHRSMNSDNSTGYKILISNNVVYNNGNTQAYYLDAALNSAAAPTDGNGIIIDLNQQTNDGKPYLGRTLITGNVLYDNGGSGAHSFQSAHVDFLNNTAYNNNICPVPGSNCGNLNEGQIFANISNDATFYNNIMVAPSGKYAFSNWKSTNIVEDYNLFGAQPIWKTYTLSPHDIVADPQFKNVASLPAGLRLKPTSPARVRGIKNPPGLSIIANTMDGGSNVKPDLGALSAQ